MNRAIPLLILPVAFILGLWGAVMSNPSFITDNFMVVWFLMVLVVISSSLGLLWVALMAKSGEEEEAEHDHGEAPEAAH